MVALGTFLITTLLVMVSPCFGVLFSEYLLNSGSSSTTTAWIFNLQCFLWNATALLTRPLTHEFGWRMVGICGAAVGATGLMISAFTPSPAFLFFSFSLLTGLGGGLVTCQCFVILPLYFQRRRGLANGIMMSGICMGQLVGPPVARFLQASYGFKGATLIIGALQLNACVGASFFHPPEWHQKKVLVEEEPQEDAPALPTKDKAVGPPDLTNGLVHSPSEASFPGGAAEGEIDGSLAVKARLLSRLEGRRASCSSSRRSSRYNSTLSLASLDVGSLAALPMEDEPKEEEGDLEGQGDILPVRVVRSLIGDLGSVKYMRACILFLGATMCINGYLNFLMMVPFAMAEAGHSPDTAAWSISVCAGCNMVTRFIVSTLSDWPRFKSSVVYSSAFALTASCMFAFTFLSSAEELMAVMALFGFGVGCNMGLYNIVIMEVMGVERLAPVFGTTCLFVAVGFICIGPFIGFMRDVTQSYDVSLRITGGMMLVALTAWLFMPLAKKVDRRREKGKTLLEALKTT